MTFLIIVDLHSNIRLLPESPRWLFTQNKEEEAYSILEKMAAVNGKNYPQDMQIVLAEQVKQHCKSILNAINFCEIQYIGSVF